MFDALSLVYGFVVRIRNLFYNWKILRIHRATVPVISIGNLTAGGTGKTPLVVWACNYLGNQDIRCSILTRGYKTEPGQITDEPALLAKQCPNTPVIVNSSRTAGARKAEAVHHAQSLIMDDGFQHRKLHRDLDIVVIDATCPFGHGSVLPAGYLREPAKGLRRASAVVITRSDHVSAQDLHQLKKQIAQFAGDVPIATTTHRHTHAISHPNHQISIDELRQEKIFAFCGIGNPAAFFDSLRKNNLNVCGTHTFDDHHVYTAEDMEAIFQQARDCGATVVLCTQKDWVKSALLSGDSEGTVFAYLAMELDFLDGVDKIQDLINDLFERAKENTNNEL